MKNLKYFICIICLIIVITFLFFYYKNSKNGNNIVNKSQDKIIDYVLNDFKEYEAKVEVTVTSNKNENKYEIKQVVTKDSSIQEVIKPENIEGLKIELDGNDLKILNTRLQLEKIYNDYEVLLNNSLFLNVFIEDCDNNPPKVYKENEEIIFEIKLENASTYVKHKKLYIDRKTGKPKKLEIKDNTKKTRTCIIYSDIEIK